jgi:hypothetical protein
MLLYRPFNQLSVTKYPNLKSVVAESEKACTDAANRISKIVNQRQYQTEDPAYYFVLCAPSYYVYALFQSSLVHLSNALRNKSSLNVQNLHQSINILKMNEDVGPAPRAIEILNMLTSINGLYHDDASSTGAQDDSANTITTTSPENMAYSTNYVHQTHIDLNPAPKSQQFFHNRLMNTSIVGGITPDIQTDIGLAMSRSGLPNHNRQFQSRQHHHHHQQQRTLPSQADQQIDSYNLSYPVYPTTNHHQPTHQVSHQRSFSLDQLNSTQHVYSHTRSISHDHFDLSNLHPASPSATAATANNSMLNHHHSYPSQLPPPQRNMMMPSSSFATHSLPQAPQAYTAAYDPNMNVSNTTLPPSSLNWSDWNVYIGHQNQHASPSLQHQQSPQHHHPTF